MTVECILTVFEEAGVNETVDVEQLTITLQEGVLSFEDRSFEVNDDSIIIGGWFEEQIFEASIYIYIYIYK